MRENQIEKKTVIEPDDIEDHIENIAEDINVELPRVKLPLAIKLIVLLITIGGLSITASTFTDIVSPRGVDSLFYTIRLITGISMLAIGYGLLKRQRWGLWLYGLVVVIALILNTYVALLPLAVLVYLVTERRRFRSSIFDQYSLQMIEIYRNIVGKIKTRRS